MSSLSCSQSLPFLAKSRGFQYYRAQQHAPGVIQTLHMFIFMSSAGKYHLPFVYALFSRFVYIYFLARTNGLISASGVRHLGIFSAMAEIRFALRKPQQQPQTSNLNLAIMLANLSPIT